MSGLFGSITIKGNRLTEFAAQTATVGIPIAFGFGKFPVEGNVIFAPMPPKEFVKKKKQGKGGVKTEEYTYTLSYAIAFCEGPIYGFWTIKRNGKVVWTQDPAASVADKAYAAKWAQKATFYFGTETQLPDSTIESYKGVGQVSAHRGIAYIVLEDDDVTDNGGAVPTYEAIVIASPPEVFLTSKPYRILAEDDLTVGNIKPLAAMNQTYDELQTNVSALVGKLSSTLVPYLNWPAENLQASMQPLTGEFKSTLKTYTFWPAENLNTNVSSLNGQFKAVLVSYLKWPAENLNTNVSSLTGTLT